MRKKKTHFFIILFIVFFAAVSATPRILHTGQKSAKKSSSKREKKKRESEIIQSLDQKYRNWLDFVSYIIHDTERKIFLELTNDRDRDTFINLFWNLRDPTPGTKENEFMIEHQRRIDYANKYFKYHTARPGWMTDRGRIYVILGEPDSIDRYEVDALVKPVQLWSYSGKGRPGLPNAFWVLFFKRDEVGEYKLYNPLSDGPYSLMKKLPSQDVAETEPESVYQAIAEMHPVLAMASVSLLPDEPSPDYRPTLRSELLLGSIYDMPSHLINPGYATNFRKYKGIVNVDYSMNFIEAASEILVARDQESGLNFVHFAVLPKTISIDYNKEKDEYYFNFRLDVSLKKGETIVFGYQKNFPFYEKKDNVENKYAAGVVISDSFPVAPGDYVLQVLIQNDIKKEFSYFERKLSVKPESENNPTIIGPVISYESKNQQRLAFMPFKFGDIEWTGNPRNEYGRLDDLFVLTGIDAGKFPGPLRGKIVIKDMFHQEKKLRELEFAPNGPGPVSFHVQPLGQLPAGNYNLMVQVLNEKGVVLKTADTTFMVSLMDHVPHPTLASKITSRENLYMYYHILGHQYMILDNLEKAEKYLKMAFELQGDSEAVIHEYCNLLFRKKEFDRMLKVAEGLRNNQEKQFEFFFLIGKGYYGKGLYEIAEQNLQKANAIYDSNVEVLNLLGLCYLKLNNVPAARQAFEASLKVYPDQKQIKDLLAKMK